MSQHSGEPSMRHGKPEDHFALQRLTRRALLARSSAAAGLLFAGGGALSACGSSTKQTTGSHTNSPATPTKVVTVAAAGAWQGFDMANPAFIANGPSLEIVQATCDTLVEVRLPASFAAAKAAADAGKLNGAPALASSWTALDGGHVYEFHLQRHAGSGFGNPLTAEDVVWSMHRLLSIPGAIGGALLGLTGLTKPSQVTAMSTHTLRFRFPAPPPAYFLQILGLPWLYVIDSVEAKKHATRSDPWATKWLRTHTAGHGMYVLQSTVPNKTAVLVPNPHYYGQKAPFAKITQVGVDDQSSRVELLLTGNAQYAEELTPLQLSKVASTGGMEVTRFTSTRVAFLVMNNTIPPFNTPELRQAIARAIPYDTIISTVYKGFAQPWRSAFIPWFQGSSDRYWQYHTDPAAAAAGLKSVKGMSVTLNYAEGFGAGQQIAVLVQQALNAAGLQVQLQGLTRAVADQKTVSKEGIPFYIDEGDSPAAPDPLYNLQYLYESPGLQNMAHYSNPQINRLTAQLAKTSGLAAQNAIVDHANRILMHDLPYIPLAYTGTIGASAKALGNVSGTEVGLVYYPNLAPA